MGGGPSPPSVTVPGVHLLGSSSQGFLHQSLVTLENASGEGPSFRLSRMPPGELPDSRPGLCDARFPKEELSQPISAPTPVANSWMGLWPLRCQSPCLWLYSFLTKQVPSPEVSKELGSSWLKTRLRNLGPSQPQELRSSFPETFIDGAVQAPLLLPADACRVLSIRLSGIEPLTPPYSIEGESWKGDVNSKNEAT